MDERPPYESYLGRSCQLFTYDENDAQIVTFEGFVFRSQLQYELYGSSRGHLVAVSQSHKMDLTPRHACYTSSSLPAIASQIAALTGLSAIVQASAQTAPKQYVQWTETDFRFLHRLADDHRAWLRPTGNGVEIFDAFQGGVALTFREEYGLLSFDVEGGIGPAAMDGCHYDPQPMASRTYSQVAAPPAFTGASGTLTDAILQGSQQMPPGYVYDRSRVPALADYEARLKLESERALGSQIVAHGISRELRVKAGDKIEIGGVIRAQGTYGVTKVVHRWTLKGYENEFWATAWEKWLEAEAPARPIVDGVFPARVVQQDEAAVLSEPKIQGGDPEKMGRHRIRFWWQEEGEPMLWARMMTPHAGQNRGIFFQPEVGDEVVVMFEDGDPERPVILGCVWNGVDTAPTADFWGGEYPDNDVKRIVTKSGNRIQMVDKPGQEAISLSTPNNLKISMYEHANETGRPMIEILNRNGDISFLAPDGRIHFHSQLFSREVGVEAASLQTNASAPGRTGSPTPQGIKKHPLQIPKKCGYLTSPAVMVGNSESFDAIRRKPLIEKSTATTYQFPGDKAPAKATLTPVVVRGVKVEVLSPATDKASTPGEAVPSVAQIANALGVAPMAELKSVHQVIISPNPNPQDSYWAKQYQIENFQSAATGGSGLVAYYPQSVIDQTDMDRIMLHEGGHTYSNVLWSKAGEKKKWMDAIKSDHDYPSGYAKQSFVSSNTPDEDFAESMVMYNLSKGTECESIAKAMYPHRYALLDAALHPSRSSHTGTR